MPRNRNDTSRRLRRIWAEIRQTSTALWAYAILLLLIGFWTGRSLVDDFRDMPSLADFKTHHERANLAPLDRLSNITRGYLDTTFSDSQSTTQLVKLYDDAEKFLTISDNYLEGCEYEKRHWRSKSNGTCAKTCSLSPTQRSDYDTVHESQRIARAIREVIPKYFGTAHSLLGKTRSELTSLLEQQKSLQRSEDWHESWISPRLKSNLTRHYKKEVRNTHLRLNLISAHLALMRCTFRGFAGRLPYFRNPEFDHYIDGFERRCNTHILGYEIRIDRFDKRKGNREHWLEGAIENIDSVLQSLEGTQVALDKICSARGYDVFRTRVTGFGVGNLKADIGVVKELISLTSRESRRLSVSGGKILKNAPYGFFYWAGDPA